MNIRIAREPGPDLITVDIWGMPEPGPHAYSVQQLRELRDHLLGTAAFISNAIAEPELGSVGDENEDQSVRVVERGDAAFVKIGTRVITSTSYSRDSGLGLAKQAADDIGRGVESVVEGLREDVKNLERQLEGVRELHQKQVAELEESHRRSEDLLRDGFAQIDQSERQTAKAWVNKLVTINGYAVAIGGVGVNPTFEGSGDERGGTRIYPAERRQFANDLCEAIIAARPCVADVDRLQAEIVSLKAEREAAKWADAPLYAPAVTDDMVEVACRMRNSGRHMRSILEAAFDASTIKRVGKQQVIVTKGRVDSKNQASWPPADAKFLYKTTNGWMSATMPDSPSKKWVSDWAGTDYILVSEIGE